MSTPCPVPYIQNGEWQLSCLVFSTCNLDSFFSSILSATNQHTEIYVYDERKGI